MTGPGEHRFVGVVYELPSNYAHIMNVALDVPAEVSNAFGLRGHVPVSHVDAGLKAQVIDISKAAHDHPYVMALCPFYR